MRTSCFALFSFCLSMAAFGCSRKDEKTAMPAASASAAPEASASAAVNENASPHGSDEVQPVYPVTNAPPDPLAARLCEALHGVALHRRAACCSHAPGFSLVPECTRTLSYALSEKAVTVDPAAVDACAAAMTKAHEGCEWVGPTGVELPAACDDLVRGALKEGETCRSSLECVDGLRCLGLGPTDPGVCRKPLPKSYPCALAADTLAALTRQDSFDVRHPECSGYCSFKRCLEFVAEGGACRSSVECGPGKTCLEGKCGAGTLPGEGAACGTKGACGKGLHCEKGKCITPKHEGAPCENDIECRGGCVRGDGGRKRGARPRPRHAARPRCGARIGWAGGDRKSVV